MAALGIGLISGTYNTAVPEYGRILTGDAHVEDLLWKGMLWFYNQLDLSALRDVFHPKAIAEEKAPVPYLPVRVPIYRFIGRKDRNL